jgi:hypothetical protein
MQACAAPPSPAQVLDVARRHSCALDHPDEGWQIVTDYCFTRTESLPQAVAPAAGDSARLP